MMYIVISPAKKQNMVNYPAVATSDYVFRAEACSLIEILTQKSIQQIEDLMHVSTNIADLNYQRYKDFAAAISHPAAFLFQGDVYKKLAAASWGQDDCEYAQLHLGILSGLYGWLRPMDKIVAYRLEMKTKLDNQLGNNLYDFWGDKVSLAIKKHMLDNGLELIVNLASNEYFKVLQPELLPFIVNVDFKEQGPKGLRIVAVNAKRARGLMANYLICNKIKSIDGIKAFNLEGYCFSKDLSLADRLVFVRQ
jgi:cytoplasmic iron level regulating protein YaaA (DUF328/UPF0246 family)